MTYSSIFDVPLAWADSNDPASPAGVKKDLMVGIHVGYYDEDSYGVAWGSFVEATELPINPQKGRWYKRYNTDNEEIREYTYNGTDWIYSTNSPGGGGSFNYIQFYTSPSVTPTPGMLWWNNIDDTVNIQTLGGAVLQIGQEQHINAYNDTGVQINNGQIVYINGASSGFPTITLAKADTVESSQTTIGMATIDIANGAIGQVTTFGYVRGLNTSSCSVGEEIYLSDTIEGGFTNIQPKFPSFRISIGSCVVVDASDGEIFFTLDRRDVISFFNGTLAETFDAIASSSDGINVTMTLERSGGGDLTQRFSSGYSTYDTSPAIIASLVPGTDQVPQMNYAYIPESTGVLTVNQTGFPTNIESIKVSTFYVPSAAKVLADGGVFMTQNWNDHDADLTTKMGHLTHVTERLRRFPAQYHKGSDYVFTLSAGSSLVSFSSATVYQLHLQTVPAADMNTGDDAHVVNWFGDANHEIADLFEITADALGNTIGNNKYFNLVFWRPANKGGTYSPIMVNLPLGSGTNEEAARLDLEKLSVFSMPDAYTIESSTGYLICRATFKMGATWTLIAVDDLRKPDRTAGSSGIGFQNEFVDSLFKIYNNIDNSKIAGFDSSNISTSTERIFSFPDITGTFALLEGTQTFTGAKTFSSDLKVGYDNGTNRIIINGDGGNNDISALDLFEDGNDTWGTDPYGFRISYEGDSNKLFIRSASTTTLQDIITIPRDSGDILLSRSLDFGTSNGILTTDGHMYFRIDDADVGSKNFYWQQGSTPATILTLSEAGSLIGTGTWRTTGKLGLGSTNPTFDFDIIKNADIEMRMYATGTNQGVKLTFQNESQDYGMFLHGTEDSLNIYDYTRGAYAFTILTDGKVGINNSTPSYTLDVNGNASIGDSTDTTDGIEVLKISTERAWRFVKTGAGAGSNLYFVGSDGKRFGVGYHDGTLANADTNLSLEINSDLTEASRYIKVWGDAYFSGGTTYKIASDGDAFFKDINAAGDINISGGQPRINFVETGFNTGEIRQNSDVMYFKVAGIEYAMDVNALYPLTDSTRDLGKASTGRWDVVYRISESSASNMDLKTGFDETVEALPILNMLKPQAFDWISNIDKEYSQEYGLILEQIPKEANYIIHEKYDEKENKNIITGIQYNNLTAMNTKGIQELDEKIILQNIKIERQQIIIEDLITRIKQLEKK
jgi:hypothetical protein